MPSAFGCTSQKLTLVLYLHSEKLKKNSKNWITVSHVISIVLCSYRTVNLDPASSFQFQLARYRPGDLGLVPPYARKHKDILSRTGTGSWSTAQPMHRFVRTFKFSYWTGTVFFFFSFL